MRTLGGDSASQEFTIDLSESACVTAQQMEEYVSSATLRLVSIADCVSRKEKIDTETQDWILTQVDFLVETIGNEAPELDDEIRSNLLQLLLAIANLNEEIRQHASLSL